MRCYRARRLLARRESGSIKPRLEAILAEHLQSCPECGRMEAELEKTWNALGRCPGIEPSADFLPTLTKKLRAEQDLTRRARKLHFHVKWQWAALAAGALLAIVLLRHEGQLHHEVNPANQGMKASAESDRSDEQLLQDLEMMLQSADADYLSAYDSWPSSPLQTSDGKPSKQSPGTKTMRKEPS